MGAIQQIRLRKARALTYCQRNTEATKYLDMLAAEVSTNQTPVFNAEVALLRVEILSNKGAYLAADSLFLKIENQIASLSKTNSELYIRYLIVGADNTREMEKTEDALALYSRVAKVAAKRLKYYLYAYEQMALINIKINNKDLSLLNVKEYEKKYKKLAPQPSPYQVRASILRAAYNANFTKKIEKSMGKFEEILQERKEVLPENHPVRAYLLHKITEVTVFAEDGIEKAAPYLQKAIEVETAVYGENSPITLITKLELLYYNLKYAKINTEKARIQYNETPFRNIDTELVSTHNTYLEALDFRAEIFTTFEEYKKAVEMLEQSAKVKLLKYGKEDWEVAYYHAKLADAQIQSGDYKNSETNIEYAVEMLKQLSNKKPMLQYGDALAIQAKLYAGLGLYDEAEQIFTKAIKIYNELSNEYPNIKGRNIEEMASLYVRLGEFAIAEDRLRYIIDIRKNLYGNECRELIKPYIELGNLYLIKGEYQTAEKYAAEALNIAKKQQGEKSPSYADALTLQARIYFAIGSYHKAEDNLLKSGEIYKQFFGNKNIRLVNILSLLANVTYEINNNDIEESEKLLIQAKTIVEANFDNKHPMYAEALKNLAYLYIEDSRIDQAIVNLEAANQIWESKLAKKNLSSAELAMLLGDVYLAKKEFKKAQRAYNRAESIYKEILSRKHPDYVKVESKLAQMHYITGDYKKANDKIEDIVLNYIEFIQKYFPSLSENEKAEFWQLIKQDFEFYNSLAVAQAETRPQLIKTMYDFSLLTKGMLLNSSIKIRKQIMNSPDTALKQLYQKWIDKKELLTSVLAMNQEEMINQNINPQIVQTEIEALEKQLSEESDIFSGFVASNLISWEDVQKSLKEGEAAVEIIRFNYFGKNGFTDTIKYAALIITPETKKRPELVVLENGNTLETKGLKFYRNCMTHHIEDDYSYINFWQPIEKAFDKNVKKVFVSPDGVYNQINIESLFIHEENIYVLDKYNINIVSNTKDIVTNRKVVEKTKRKKTTSATTNVSNTRTAVLFGNPNFYSKPTIEHTAYANQQRGIGSFIAALPGTDKEIKAIQQMLTAKNWQIKSYTKEQASEQILKNLESPTVLHIATHGFFDEKPNNSAGISTMSATRIAQNPLLRSGILTANAGDMLLDRNVNYNSQDGVLTAFEAMNLNFDNTDLVILSACETGLGKVEAGEGVFGLQRAFLVAGAKTIVMSLFKVSDDATQKLMTLFYQKWLQTGKIHESFYEARKELRKEYPEPIYWGAFNIVGVE
jgi:CHAT domain-containing protein